MINLLKSVWHCRKICGSPLSPFAWARAWGLAWRLASQDSYITNVQIWRDSNEHALVVEKPDNRGTYIWEDSEGNLWESPRSDDRTRGRCTGIPECCIDYFISGGLPSKESEGWYYVPCPECLRTGNRITPRQCEDRKDACTCGTWTQRKPVDDSEPVCPYCFDTGWLEGDPNEIDCDCGAALQSDVDRHEIRKALATCCG